MSFAVKAVKRVFKKVGSFVKRLVDNKWFRVAALTALTVFTAGIGSAGGWAAFAAKASGNGIGGFFSAVGSTMSSGFTSIVNGVKTLGQGAKNWLTGGSAQQAVGGMPTGVETISMTGGGGPSMSPVVAEAGTKISQAIGTGVAEVLPHSAVGQGVATPAAQGFLGRMFSAFTSPSIGGSMLRQGVMYGAQAYAQSSAARKERKLRKSRQVAGGAAFGGSSDYGYQPLHMLDPTTDPMEQTGAGAEAARMAQSTVPAQQQQQQQQQGPQQGILFEDTPAFQPSPLMAQAQQQRPSGRQPQPTGTQPGGILLENLGVA